MLNLYKSIPALKPTDSHLFITTDKDLHVTGLSPHLLKVTGKINYNNRDLHIRHLFSGNSLYFQHISADNNLNNNHIFFTSGVMNVSNGSKLFTYWFVTPVFDELTTNLTTYRWTGFENPGQGLFSEKSVTSIKPFRLVYHDKISSGKNSAPLMIWITDEYKKTLYINRHLADYTGMKADQPLHPEFHPEDSGHSIILEQKSSGQHNQLANFSRIRNHLGEYNWFYILSLPIYLKGDFYPGFITYMIELKEDQVKEIITEDRKKHLYGCVKRPDNELTIVNLEKIFRSSGFSVELKNKINNDENALAELKAITTGREFKHDIWNEEISILRNDGNYQHFYLSVTLITSYRGECAGMILINRDITDKQKPGTTDHPQHDEMDCVSFHAPDGRYVFVSEEFKQLTGYDSAELTGKTPELLNNSAEDEPGSSIFSQHQLQRVTSTVVYCLQKKNRQQIWLESTIQPLVDLDNNLLGMYAVTSNIAGKKPEPDLRVVTEHHFEYIAENAPSAIFRLNNLNRITYCNVAFENILQVPFDMLQGKTLASIGITGEALKNLYKEIDHVFDSGLRSTLPIDIIRKDGTCFYFLTTLVPEFNEINKKVQSILAISKDITEVRKKEIELRSKERELVSSHERFSLAVKATTNAIWELNFETGEIYLSDEFTNKFGFTESELKGKPGDWYLQRIHPEDRDQALLKIRKVLLDHSPFWKDEFRWMCKDGSYKYILNQASILFNEAHAPYKGIGAIQDITESKINEDLLLRKEKLLSAVAVTSNELIIEQHLHKTINNCLEKIGLAADVDRVVLFKFWEEADKNRSYLGQRFEWHSETTELPIENPDVSRISAARMAPMPDILKDGGVFMSAVKDIPFNFLRENLQRRKTLSVLALPVFVNAELWGFVGFEQCSYERSWEKTEIDIFKTFASSLSGALERKEKDKKLQDSEEKFKALFLNSTDIVFVVDEACFIKYVTPGIEKILGYLDHTLLNKGWFDLVHPDDMEKIHHEFTQTLNNPAYTPLRAIRVQHINGTWIWMEAKGQNKCLNPNINGIILSLRDITERQLAQQTLTEYSEMITGILNSITDGFAAIDKNANITLWNHVAEKLIGRKKEDVLGKNLMEEFPVLINSTINLEIKKALVFKTTVNFEQHIRSTDRWFDTSMFPYEDGLFIYFKDVTVKKKQEMFLAIEKMVLEINSDPKSTLKNTVDIFLNGIENIHRNILCSVLLLDESNATAYHLSAPRLPGQFITALHGKRIGPDEDNCISHMFAKQRVIVSDIATHPHWSELREITTASGLMACWSIPILNAQEEVIGALACYYEEPKIPEPEEISVVERTANLLRVIIENKRAEEKVRISNDLFILATRATNQAVWNLDVKSEILSWGEGFYRLFGYKTAYKVNNFKFWVTHIHPEEREKVVSGLRKFMHRKSPHLWEDEYRLKKSDGNYAVVSNKGYLIYDNNGDPIQMVGSIEDITEKKRLEKKLIKQEIDKQKLVAQVVVDAQEQERATIGKELHDNVNQILSTAKLFLEVAKAKPKERVSMINRSAEQIKHAINEIRSITQSLAPPSISDLGLVESIKDLVENIAVTKTLEVNFSNVGDIENALNDNQKVMLFRIIQEQVNNVLKHAEAKHLNIQLTVDNSWIELVISDDGRGFNPAEIKLKKGVGLSNIVSRAELFNGTVKIISAPGKGCKVVVKVLRIYK